MRRVGGNAGDGMLVGNAGEVFARISYNGCVWPNEPWKRDMVPLREPTHEDFEAAETGARAIERMILAAG